MTEFMTTNFGKLVVVAGIDGSGKSTVISKLLALNPGLGYSHWSLVIEEVLPRHYDDPSAYIETLSQHGREEFIAKIITAEFEHVIRPQLERGRTVIADSYIYKFWAKESVIKRSPASLYSTLRLFPAPGICVFIDTPPIIALDRKREITTYESPGGHRADFVHFQLQVRDAMLACTSDHSDDLVVIDGLQSPADVVRDVMSALIQHDRGKPGTASHKLPRLI